MQYSLPYHHYSNPYPHLPPIAAHPAPNIKQAQTPFPIPPKEKPHQPIIPLPLYRSSAAHSAQSSRTPLRSVKHAGVLEKWESPIPLVQQAYHGAERARRDETRAGDVLQ